MVKIKSKSFFVAMPLTLALVLTLLAPIFAEPVAAQRLSKFVRTSGESRKRAATPAATSTQLQQFPVVVLPPGYRIDKVVGGLTYPTSITWDNTGQMYVAEAGGGFLEEGAPARILRVTPGQATEIVNLTAAGVRASAVGLVWYNGAFYFTHRAEDRTGAVSRVRPGGAVELLFKGILDSQAEHQINDIKVRDGRMYVTSGPATNSGIVGIDLAPFVALSPNLRATPCVDTVLTGVNYLTPDFRTVENETDTALTGAYVPFGTPTSPGQRIPGTNKCGGSILVFDPNNAEATVRPFAHGFRNIIGIAFNERGDLFATQNGYDIRGSRPTNDQVEPTFRVRENVWYGFPDFSGALEPFTDPKFDSPDSLQAPKFLRGKPLPKNRLHFLIDHAASGLTPPDRSLLLGLHEINSSPSLLDVAPSSWGDLAGQLFIAEWGDLAPATTPLRDKPTGSRIVRLNPADTNPEQTAVPFASNVRPGPASEQGAPSQGLERPFDVKFGPDGAMYIVDYGVVRVNPADAKPGDDVYEFPPRTGAIWRVTRTAGAMNALGRRTTR